MQVFRTLLLRGAGARGTNGADDRVLARLGYRPPGGTPRLSRRQGLACAGPRPVRGSRPGCPGGCGEMRESCERES